MLPSASAWKVSTLQCFVLREVGLVENVVSLIDQKHYFTRED